MVYSKIDLYRNGVTKLHGGLYIRCKGVHEQTKTLKKREDDKIDWWVHGYGTTKLLSMKLYINYCPF